jgi:hypothetical protein
MIKLWIDRETVKLFISSGQTEVKNHGYDCRGKKYVTIFETEFTADDHLNENPLWWVHDIHESPLEAAPPDPKLPVTRISLRDSFPGNPCRNRGIYKLGTATAELERRERTDEFWGRNHHDHQYPEYMG